MNQLVFQRLGFGKVLYQQHQATVAWGQRLVDGRLVQVQPARLAVQRKALLVQVLVGHIDETLQQAAPGFADGDQA